MALRTLKIADENPLNLPSGKRKQKSSSDVIKRRHGESLLAKLAGILTKEESERMRAAIKTGRDSLNAHTEQTARRML